MADDIAGIVLEIPPSVFDNINKADKAIKQLQATSLTAAQKIKGHFDNTAVSGLNTFITKVQKAQSELNGLSLPSWKGVDMGKIGSDAAKSANDINLLVQSISQLTSALSKNKAVRAATKNVAPQETEYSKVTAELAKQTDRYVQLSQAIAAYNQKKFEETTHSERTQNAANVAELQTLQQSISLLRDKVALMERAKQAGVDAVNPNLETRRANAELDAMNKAYAEEEKASARKAAKLEKDRQREAEAAKKSYEQQQKMYEKLFGKGGVADQQVLQSLANQKAATLATPQGAMDYAKNVRTLKEMTEAYRNLKAVMNTVDPKSKDWLDMNNVLQKTKQNIDEIRKKMGEFSSQSQRLSGIAGQLKNMLVGVFSVSAIKSYITELVKVRAQFELQNVALRAILQNKDEADRIFAQVQQMALQSPFSIMQLTTYTKQLAAYRIEADKLVGTTKMLADVSAGLGVDIQRLILAYGQVKSANYLRACLGRGTEIKTMRGIVKVEDIVIGDKLYNDHNEVTTVAELYSGTQQMYKFTELAPDGYSYRVNEAHILTMYDKQTNAVVDVKVIDYLQYPERYMGVRMSEGEICTYAVKCQKDIVDEYFGFKLDGNKRFQLVDGTITHNTEVRQFTEAGLNIAGELAQYFSELQGKMISVGDVMEMITKRMVRFEDVEEVFKRVTSAGGLFYDMQKKQSETLSGQMQRIGDAISIMFNEIGKSNQGFISGVLSTLRTLISSWRQILPLVSSFASFLAIRTLTPGVAWLAKNLITVVKVFKQIITLQIQWNTLAKANVWGAVLGVLSAIVVAIISAKNATSALAEELGRIRTESATDLKESIADFHQLAKTATDVTKSYTERKEALEALNRAYRDILPSYMLEAEWLEKQVGNYDAAIAKIQEYFQAKEMQKHIDTILNSEDYQDAIKDMQELGESMLKDGVFDVTVTKQYTDKWMQTIASEIASGKIENSAQAVSKRLSEIFGKSIEIPEDKWEKISKHFQNLDNEINSITLGTASATTQTELWGKELEKLSPEQLQKRIAAARREQEELNHAIAAEQVAATMSSKGSGTERAHIQNANKLIEKYDQLTVAIEAYEQAMAGAWAREQNDAIQEQIGKLHTQIRAYSDLLIKRNELERTNTGTEAETKKLAELNAELAKAGKGVHTVAYKMGVELTATELGNIDNMFELERLLNKVAQEAYPKLATKSVEEVGKGETAVKNLIDKIDLLKRAINSFSTGLGFGKVFEDEMTDADTKTEEEKKEIERLKQIESDRNEQYIKDAAKRAGVDAKLLTSKKQLTRAAYKSDSEYAKELRAQAKIWKEQKAAVDGMSDAQRKFYFETNKLSQSTVDELAKAADVAEDVANAYSPEALKKTKGRSGGTDPWIEVFKERTKAVQDFYKQYETLREKFSETESQRRDIASFEQYFQSVGLNMADVISKGWDTRGLVANIEQLQADLKKHFGAIYDEAEAIMRKGITLDVVENPTAGQKLAHNLAKLIHDLEKQAADNKVKIDIEIQEDRLEKLKQEFNDVFANYDLTKELGNLGLNVDLTYLVGGKPMTLAQARKELQDTYNKALAEGQLGEDAEKAYKDALKKLADLEHKAQIDRLKNYNKYLIESVGERAQIELKAAQDITKIRNDETLDDFSKEQAILQRRKKMYEELTKFDFDQFKGGDVYLSVFKDLEAASKEQLTYVISKLKEMQSTFKDLSPVQVKSIASEIKKLEEALAGKDSVKNLFTNLKESIKYARQRKDLLKEQTTIQQKLDANQKAESDAEKYLVELTQQRDAIQDRLSDEWEEANKKVLEQQAFVKKLKDRIKELEDELGIVTDKIDKGTLSWESFSAGAKNISQYVGAVKQAVDDIFEGLNSAFNLNDSTRDAFESVSEILGGLGKTMEGLAEIDFTKPLSVITGIGKAIGGIFSTIGGFFGIGDKKKERQIQRLTDKVNDLSKAYDKLQDSMEEAYTFDDYNASYQRMQKTLEAEKMAYREMIALEQAKKKSDKDKIKEYEDALDELAEKEAEIRKERIEAMGSTTDYLNEAENFVSAWLDAYKETGDGLDALGDKWNDFIENLFVKQAAAQIVSAKLKPIIDTINKAIEENKTDFDLSEAIDDARQEWEEAIKEIQPILEKLFGSYGLTKDTGELVLSDLQKGIQNITEPQAAAIEAYLNSMRFEMFHHTEQLDKLITAIQTQYGGGDSPILVEVRAIRSILTNIDDRFRSITESATGRGLVLKVN